MDVRCNRKMGITREEDQNMPPPPNMLLWHEDYFEVKAIKKQQTQEEPAAFPFSD